MMFLSGLMMMKSTWCCFIKINGRCFVFVNLLLIVNFVVRLQKHPNRVETKSRNRVVVAARIRRSRYLGLAKFPFDFFWHLFVDGQVLLGDF